MKKICRLLSAMLIVAMVLSGCGKVNTPDTEIDTQQTESKSETENVATSEMETERTETISETTIEVETETQTESEIPSEPEAQTYTYTDMDKTMYVKCAVNVRSLPSTDGEKLGGFSKAQEVHVIGQCNENHVSWNGHTLCRWVWRAN